MIPLSERTIPLVDFSALAALWRKVATFSIVKVDMTDFETPANDPAITENLPEPRWSRIGGDVVILGRLANIEISDRASDQVGFMAVLVQTVHDPDRILVDILPGDRMFGARDDPLIERGSCAVGVRTFVFQGYD